MTAFIAEFPTRLGRGQFGVGNGADDGGIVGEGEEGGEGGVSGEGGVGEDGEDREGGEGC